MQKMFCKEELVKYCRVKMGRDSYPYRLGSGIWSYWWFHPPWKQAQIMTSMLHRGKHSDMIYITFYFTRSLGLWTLYIQCMFLSCWFCIIVLGLIHQNMFLNRSGLWKPGCGFVFQHLLHHHSGLGVLLSVLLLQFRVALGKLSKRMEHRYLCISL